MAPPQPAKGSNLVADYKSPSASETFTKPISPSTSTPLNTSGKTAHLASIRAAIPKLQDDINAFLTQKMEEDKGPQAARDANGTNKTAIDDAKEEENYGEEIVEEED
ncbi:MAG: hypothetical protein M4579_001954 [Chaenotheca gracillima]|nr:MAG: hypothetical protein M4579_001954 [Chaenotheca gracillima]